MKNNQIQTLQNHLSSLRKIAGWSMQELGDKIGVTKQTISNLENHKTLMTQTQYIAIRTVLDYEINTNKENTVLAQVVELLLNKSDSLTNEEYKNLITGVEIIAATAVGGITGSALGAVSAGVMGGVLGFPILTIGSIATSGVWLSKILKNKKKEKK